MLVPLFLLALCGTLWADKHIYHTFNLTTLNDEEYQHYVDEGVAPFCTIEIEDCDATEGRRLDGSCNNLRYPTMGATHTPMLRFLPANYADGISEVRKAKSGQELPNGRRVRTQLLFDGRISDRVLTNLVPMLWLLFAADSSFPQDTTNYMVTKPGCCTAEGKGKNKCIQLEIPADDHVHRFSGHRCMNLTEPLSYQNTGCIANGTLALERINTATPLIDLSLVYGSVLNVSLEKQRLYKDGLMKYDELDGNIWPPTNDDSSQCTQNVGPHETRCHNVADTSTNSLLGMNLGLIWFYRQHNRLAGELKELNPCWDDEKLFNTARDINIGLGAQICYYELMPLLLGKTNLLNDKIISADTGFRDFYDENIIPQLTPEYIFALRWAHTIVEGDLKLYDNDGNHYKNFPIVNATFRTGWLAIDDNIGGVTRGLFRQGAGKAQDNVVDPGLVENGLGTRLLLHDILSADNLKSRFLGYKPYIEYISKCSGKTYSSWNDLTDIMDDEKIELLQNAYADIEDVDLMAGMWMERKMEGANAPPTIYCLLADQLKRNIVTDRHWYERKDRPNAFTYEQLQEIRKASVSRVLCTVGDNITRVQPRALERPGPGNEIGECDQTTQDIDMSVWKDDSCSV